MPELSEWRRAREEANPAAPPFVLTIGEVEVAFRRDLPLAVPVYLADGDVSGALRVWVGPEGAVALLEAGLTVDELRALIEEMGLGGMLASGPS